MATIERPAAPAADERNVNESIVPVAPDAWLPAIAQSLRLQG
jgi:hypothetical protein